jgi:Zn-dependent protease/CBS domain-containing protein
MWNFRIGTITDIPIKVNISLLLFLPVLAWLIASGEQIGVYVGVIEAISPQTFDGAALSGGDTALVVGGAGAVGLFASVLLHELGHAWMARRYDIPVVSITLWIFGGLARMREIPEEWNQELWIALAGPAVSLALGVGGIAALQVLPGSLPVLAFVVGFLGIVNVTLVVFNLLPAFPMDGGRVLRALLARSQPYAQATQTAATVGKGMAVLMALVGIGLLGPSNPILVLIALFIYMGASSESKAAVMRELLRGVVVGDMMRTEVPTVRPDDTVAALVERIMVERVAGFPVLDDGAVVGVVTLDDVRGVAAGDREGTPVREVMRADPATVGTDDDAFRALQAFGEHGGPLVVVDAGRFVGLVTEADFVRTIEVIEGVGPKDEPELSPEGYA